MLLRKFRENIFIEAASFQFEIQNLGADIDSILEYFPPKTFQSDK